MDGHAHMLAINVLAPYQLTALVAPPPRLVYLSGGMHRGGTPSIDDLDWERRQRNGAQAYSASKLFDATFTAAVARRWPGVLSNAVEPGWGPTKMGGPGAPDDLAQAHVTQAWLAVSEDGARSSAAATSTTAHRATCCSQSVPAHSRMSCWTS
jgi:NAD(P)-dependent dehydrogenase (short-subunit alcohol dehydrogenase family)